MIQSLIRKWKTKKKILILEKKKKEKEEKTTKISTKRNQIKINNKDNTMSSPLTATKNFGGFLFPVRQASVDLIW